MSKRVFVRNHPYENAIRLQVHIHANETRIYVQGFRTRTRFETEAQGNSGNTR